VKAPAPARATASARESYTIQLAAYNTRADADRLVAKLASRGVTARVSGENKPFRVRLGFYKTRQAAANEVAALKARGIIGFVTTEPAPEGKTP
jgi:cell division protein FtsN